MTSRWMQVVVIGSASVLMAHGVGCSRLTTEMVAGVYDLDSAVVRYDEKWELEEHATDDEIATALGWRLSLVRGVQLYLLPNGNFVLPFGEPGLSGTWTIESDRVVGYEKSLDFMLKTVVTRYEAEWNDGVLRILANDPNVPIDYVFVKQKEGLND